MGSQRTNGRETLAGEILAANEVLAHYDPIAGLYMRVGELVYNVALKHTQDPDVAEDIRQKAFLRACDHYDQDTWTPEYERRWMARVTVNLTKDYWRHRYRFPEESIETYYQTIPSAEDQTNPLEDLAEHLDTLEVARNCLDNVSRANRAATWLYYGEGMGPQEIGDVLGTSKSLAATRASRGLLQAQQALMGNDAA